VVPPGVNPVRELTKIPEVVPSVVLELFIVGFVVVAQQIPLDVIAPPPLEVMFPPETADVWDIEVITEVVTVGSDMLVATKDISFPYEVPAVFVAYALT
jgi:hypothetical protein